MNLYELACETSANVNTYRNADTSDFKEAFQDILAILKCGISEYDHIDDIEITDDHIKIDYSWSVRCCEQEGSCTIPMSIILSENPSLAANRYQLEKEIQVLKDEVSSLQAKLNQGSESLKKLQDSFNKLGSM